VEGQGAYSLFGIIVSTLHEEGGNRKETNLLWSKWCQCVTGASQWVYYPNA
jgi:hypothetical protein